MSNTPATEAMDEPFATRLRGFGPIGILAIVLILAGNFIVAPLSAVLVLVWARFSQTAWRELGFIRPKNWIRTVTVGIFFGVAFKFVMKALVMPLLGAPPINQAYHYLAGNSAAMPAMILTMIIVAGFGEETVFRGYLFERLGKLFGTGSGARAVMVLLTSAWFALLHYPEQGLPGVEQAAFTGLVFGTIFAVTRQLWMLMVAHAAFDLTALAMIYWKIEFGIAHLLFK
jgi:membrane protease YdiL (CAAX protease family)